MRWTEPLKLVRVEKTLDEYLQERDVKTERTVRANAWRISFAEKAQAGLDAMRGSVRLEVQTQVYFGETEAVYQGKRYSVDAERRGFRTILTLTEVANVNS